jgi:chromosome segregation ATPase
MVPYTSIPISSALLLILVGILIGHLFWYRYRGEPQREAEYVPRPIRESAWAVALPAAEPPACQPEFTAHEAELASVKASYQSLEARWHQLQTEYERLSAELTRAKHEHQQAARLLEEATDQDEIAALRKETEELRSLAQQNVQLKEQLASLQVDASELVPIRAKLNELQASIDDRDNQILVLQERHDALERLQCESTERLTLANQQRDAAAAEAHDLKRQLNELYQSHEAVTQNRHSSQLELETLCNELAEVRQRLEQTLANLALKEDELLRLREQIEEFEQASAESAELETMLQETADRLKVVARQRDAAIQAEKSTKEIVAELRDELNDRLEAVEALRKDKDETIAKLAREKQLRLDLETQVKSTKTQSAEEMKLLSEKVRSMEQHIAALEAERQQLAAQVKQERPKHFITLSSFKGLTSNGEGFDEADKIRFDEKIGAVYELPPNQPDDLKKISGVAETLQQKLNGLGIYKYQQIMQWDDVAVESISKQLAVDDCVQRENWIGQARRLYREHYGSRAA